MDPIHLLAIAGRVSIVYVVLLILLRVGGKKEMAQMTPMDLLTMLLLSETVQQAMLSEDTSVLGGLVAATTLIVLALVSGYAIDYRPRNDADENHAYGIQQSLQS